MINRRTKHPLLPLLVVGITLAMAVSAQAQNRQYQGSGGTSASLQITFGTTPHWTSVRGTRVSVIRQSERPDYDMFRYGGRYYAYQNNRWYMSRRSRGQFNSIDDRYVPTELSRVPRDHWRNYPSGWGDNNRYPNSDRRGQRR